MRTPGNTLAMTHPALAAELADPRQASLAPGTHTKVAWRCSVDPRHEWTTSVVARTRMGSGCPVCSGRVPLAGVSDLATTHPGLAAQLVDPARATTVGAGSSIKLEWRCATDPGHTWTASVRNRAQKGTGCPACAGRAPRSATRHPSLAELDHPLLAEAFDPQAAGRLSLGSGVLVQWRCTECAIEHTFTASVRRRLRGQGCPVRSGAQVVPGINDLATTHPELADQLVDRSLAATLSRGSTAATQWRCAQGHAWSTPVYARVAGNGCPHCCPIGSSCGEQELLAAVLELDPGARHRVRIPGTASEVDVLAGGLAVEFNGTFWHSEAGGRSRTHHRDKLEAVRRAGWSLLTVWEDDWGRPERRAVLVRTLAHRLHALDRLPRAFEAAGLDPLAARDCMGRHGARTLQVVELSGTGAAEFFTLNHVQGAVALGRTLALVDACGVVRSALGLRSPRHSARARRKEGWWEIQRYATRGLVPGGFTRLLAHAGQLLRAEGEALAAWVSLSADESSDGELYAAAGFEHAGQVAPNYWYTGGRLRHARQPKEAFQKRRFATDPALVWQEGWTEREAATANGLHRVWDAGKTRWVKTL